MDESLRITSFIIDGVEIPNPDMLFTNDPAADSLLEAIEVVERLEEAENPGFLVSAGCLRAG
jgi:hypothetical protein